MKIFSTFIYKDELKSGLINKDIYLKSKKEETFFESNGLIFIDTKNSHFGEMVSESVGGKIQRSKEN